MTRVLVVHPGVQFSVSDVFRGVVAGFEANGCTVATLNLADRLDFYGSAHVPDSEGGFRRAFDVDAAADLAAQGIEVACYEVWPDVVVVVSGWFVPPKVWGVLAKRPHHTVYWGTESPYEDDRQARPARYVDTVVVNDPTNLEWFRSDINPRTFYVPHSFDPNIHFRGAADPELVCDFGFVGTGFPSRIKFFEQVDWSGIDVKLGGNWRHAADGMLAGFVTHGLDQCMPNEVTASMYRSARVSANLYRKETSDGGRSDGWAMGPREVELAACGAFFLRESRPEGDELFPWLPVFDSPAAFEEQLRWWLQHPVERAEAGLRAWMAVQDRTFQKATANVLKLIDSAPVSL